MISVAEAQAKVLALCTALPPEDVPLVQAAGCWLNAPVTALRDQPPFDASAMDGYAVTGNPVPGTVLRVIGMAAAGGAFAGTPGPDEAVRIFTGAPVPPGCTRVLLQEDVERTGDRITVTKPAEASTHIRPRGQDFRAGAVMTPRVLRGLDLALIASMGVARVLVTRRPVVAILPTGDELVQPGETPRSDQIFASTQFALKPLLEAAGAEVRVLPLAPDSETGLAAHLALAEGCDLIVTLGGASVGDHDLIGSVTASLGMERAFWRIAMRPGKPLIAGKLGRAVFLGLPGNPVSAIVCAHLFVLPAVRAMLGQPDRLAREMQAVLEDDLEANGPRAHYMRARLTATDGQPLIRAMPRQDSSLLGVLAEADALLIRPANDGPRPRGSSVAFLAF